MRSFPETAAYDSIWHLLDFDGDATNDDVLVMQVAYLEVAVTGARPAYTCLVTHDPCMKYWATAMDEQFPGRIHLVMRSVEQAGEWLEQIRGRLQAPTAA
ncbi:MAG: hypothetical protein JO303_16480 [Caulobacteraceae bacterium]|nr:hypothetical protein [Caulobacteraceae bacterium]